MSTADAGFSVSLIAMEYRDEAARIVSGFRSLEAAREYARRRTRDSLEALRRTRQSADELRRLWLLYGEDCVALEGDYCGGHEVDFFIEHPATTTDRDWQTLAP